MNRSKANHEEEYRNELTGISKGAGFTALGFVFMLIASFFTNALITRTLGAGQYGLYVLATRVMDILQLVAIFGFGTTIVRNLSFFYARDQQAKVKGIIVFSQKAIVVISSAVAVIGFVTAEIVAVNLFDRPELSSLIRILMLAIPVASVATVYISSLTGLKQIRVTVLLSNFFNPALMLMFVSIIAFAGLNLEAIIWSIVLAAICGLIVSRVLLSNIYLRKVRQLKPRVNKKEVWNYATPLFFNQLFNKAINLVPIFIMGLYQDNTQIGIFNVGFRIALLVSFSLAAFHLIFAPVMSGLFAKNDRAMIGRLYKTITKWIFSISLVVLFIIILYSKTLLGIFGPEFITGGNILLILSAGEFVNAAVGQAGNLIIVSGRPRLALVNSVAASVLVIILSLILIPTYGATGAAIAVAVSISLINIVRVIELVFLEKIHPFKINFFKPLLAAVISGLLIFLFNSSLKTNAYLELVLGSLLFIAIFVIINLLLKPDAEDKFIINRILKFIR
ncbi:MAG: oligosaccharide flippase family protein [Bacteroidales bacterium]|nr:oligosaccharide flippase family protein [Bacteroidales bacterium]